MPAPLAACSSAPGSSGRATSRRPRVSPTAVIDSVAALPRLLGL